MISRLTLFDYRYYNPGRLSFRTDSFYFGIANQLLKVLQSCEAAGDFDTKESSDLALWVAHYFEDVVSDAGFWRAFTEVHQQRHGRPLPFFDLSDIDEYYPDEIHHQDIQFVIWNYLQSLDDHRFLNPENPFIAEIAIQFTNLLLKRYDDAPVNEGLLDYLYGYDDVPQDDLPFWIRERAGWIVLDNYLFRSPGSFDFLEEKVDPLREYLPENEAFHFGYALFTLEHCCGPLNMNGFDVYAAICRNAQQPHSAEIVSLIDGMQFKPLSFYFEDSVGESEVILKTIDGQSIQVSKTEFTSVEGSDIEVTLKTRRFLLGAFIQWNGKWMPWGTTSWTESDEDYKRLCEESKSKQISATRVPQIIREKFGTQKLFFLKNIDSFKDFQQEVYGKELPILDDAKLSDFPRDTPVALLLDEESGDFTIIPGADAFPHPSNPYYDAAISSRKAFELLLMSPYLFDKKSLNYLINQGCFRDAACNSIYGSQRGHQLVQDNIRFLADYFLGM